MHFYKLNCCNTICPTPDLTFTPNHLLLSFLLDSTLTMSAMSTLSMLPLLQCSSASDSSYSTDSDSFSPSPSPLSSISSLSPDFFPNPPPTTLLSSLLLLSRMSPSYVIWRRQCRKVLGISYTSSRTAAMTRIPWQRFVAKVLDGHR